MISNIGFYRLGFVQDANLFQGDLICRTFVNNIFLIDATICVTERQYVYWSLRIKEKGSPAASGWSPKNATVIKINNPDLRN